MSKVLVLTSREIFPTYGGDKLRIFKICEYLSKYHSLDIISLTDKKDFDYCKYPKILQIFDQSWSIYHHPLKAVLLSFRAIVSNKSMQEWYYYNARLFNFLEEKKNNYDYILIHLFRMEQYARDFDASNVHVDLTDAISMNYSRLHWDSLKSFMEILYLLERKKILRREKRILQKYSSVSLISNADKKYLGQFESVSNVKVFKNGVNLERFKLVEGEKEKNIVFIGNIGSAQNKDACQFFINDILPSLNRKYPHIKFKIVGIIPEQLKKSFQEYTNVIVTGKVKSIQKAVGNPVCAVCPMRYGAGIQNKILEYLAMGIPVVSSKMGMEGLENLRDHVFVAETPDEYVIAIKKILMFKSSTKFFSEDCNEKKIDKNMLRSSVEELYSWNHILDGFENIFNYQNTE